jgi:hypothetical protein
MEPQLQLREFLFPQLWFERSKLKPITCFVTGLMELSMSFGKTWLRLVGHTLYARIFGSVLVVTSELSSIFGGAVLTGGPDTSHVAQTFLEMASIILAEMVSGGEAVDGVSQVRRPMVVDAKPTFPKCGLSVVELTAAVLTAVAH